MADDYMREEILFQSDIFKRFFDSQNLPTINLQKFSEIWFTGSGDSHCASLFGSALANLQGYTARALTPMNASYFMNHNRDISLLLFGISVSGKTPRVLEVVQKVKKNYSTYKTVGLSDNPHSDLAKVADETIIIQASPSDVLEVSDYKDGIAKLYTGYHHDVAQTKTYFANLVYILAIIYPKFFTNKNYNHSLFTNWLIKAEELAKNNPIKYPQKTIFVGSGLEESLAQFGKYKWFEYTFPGLHQDIEEYAHTHYFTTDQRTTVVFFAPKGPLLDRALELINGALGELIKPQIILITDTTITLEHDVTVLYVLEDFSITSELSALDIELWYHIHALILLEWYTYHTARNNGFDTNKFRGGAEGEKYVRGSYHTIRKSKINN